MINRSGDTYTVDEASALLGVPRPTLYRYLKEYSIPYQRRSGRISVPEESLERIRTVRELHDEGLGTAAVRRRLQAGEGSDVDWIAERLDRLSEALETSQSSLKPTEGVSSSQALHIILARQSLLISAVFNLTEMMEELLAVSGRPRKPALDYLDEQSRLEADASLPPDLRDDALALRGVSDVSPGVRAPAEPEPIEAVPVHGRRDGFGALARRRRRTVAALAFLVILGVVAAGVFFWRAAGL
ncbi:MAG TPA: helix-turn-helix domain-containing protein [Rubrobacteraceae bacterium]|nr:helix-turn-helix domain-containing protein [Rubrobacteraceae bacterium]